MSLLSEYEDRTSWKYEPIHGTFHTHEGLTNKVNQDGSYVVFPGTTVVFRPDKRCLQIIQLMQRVLDQQLQGTGMLMPALPASTIHMTLHDLVSPEQCVSVAAHPGAYEREMAESLNNAVKIVEKIRKDYVDRKIIMVADRIVNMVSKSLVLLLKPRTEQDYELLLDMYGRFDEIVSLPYPLTPHITLVYFKPGLLDGDRLGKAVNFAQIDPDQAPMFEFYPEGLTAKVFRDMQSYVDIPQRICFCCDGGLNRSVLAANILSHMARARGLPMKGEARSAYQNTQGRPVPEQVWKTLEQHGIQTDRTYATARFLEKRDVSLFSHFAGITMGAMNRISWIGLPEERVEPVSRFYYGVRDPEYGEMTYEQAFLELYDRTASYLDWLEDWYQQTVGSLPALSSLLMDRIGKGVH